ncbi:MBL fold metallo-hydrolase [Psychrobium sp. 1_MG-2023]|uniref:MBL fold metallo-hydrolase n=1 Tax=Psychrobium sp. 1_MG-2023 TaxID=3062624 RepID=UPI0027322E4F|nr:MBL fold metallo-hydrolase [Psychrobium sp. 1_MG-2023]MDP2562725.1 MBL fold metallo-hydrolase [Psychrobium sp. 1_MG-2023]
MKHQVIPVTQFAQNCTVIWCDETNIGAVIDPGGDIEKITSFIDTQQISVEKILLTHAHIDHAGGTSELSKRLNLTIEGPHQGDLFWINGLAQQAQMFGFEVCDVFEPTRWLEDGDTVTVGNEVLDVLLCPGHTPGHVVFVSKALKLAWVGDVLFAGSIGRTDFPQGDHQTLINSICSQLWPLGNDIEFICGHGPNSTFGKERASNPLVGDRVTGLS